MDDLRREPPQPAKIFEQIIDAIPHMVWVAGPDGGLLYHNARIRDYSGLSSEEIRGNGWERMLHPDDVLVSRAAAERSITTGVPFEIEQRLRGRDGRYRWFLVRAEAERDQTGRVIRWVGTATDVEDRRAAEARYRAIFENSFEAVNLASADGALLYASPASSRLLGRAAAQELGQDVFELIHPEDRPSVQAVFGKLLTNVGGFAEFVFRARHADGSHRWLEARATNLLHDPAVAAVVINFRDVSERIAAEEKVRESERRFRELFEANPHPMWVFDPQTLGFLAVNDAAVARYGYSREEFLNMTLAHIRPAEDVPALRDCVDRPGDGLRPRGVWRHQWKDGTLRNVDVSTHVVRFADRPSRLVLALDVTDRLRAEEALARGLGRLRAVVENMADGLVVADPDGNLLEWNPAALRMHRYGDLREVRCHISKFAKIFTLSRPGEPPLSFDDWPMQRVLRGQTVVDERLIVHRLDTGLELVLRYSGAPVRLAGGSVEFGVLTIHDVTEWERAEGEARRTTEMLKAVADSTIDPVFVKDRDGRYLLANPAAVRFLNRPVEEILGRTDAELMDADDARSVLDMDRRVMEGGRAETAEETITAGGVARTFLSTKAPRRDEEGNVIGLIGIAHDVTERNRLATERAALLRRLQLHVERMPLAYILYDADMIVTEWNPAAERIFGHSRAEAVGGIGFFEQLIPAHCRREVAEIFRRVRMGDMAAHSVSQNLTKDGRTITCEWINTPLMKEDGAFGGLLCLAQDVTERKVLEEQFRQAQKMEAVGRLAAGTAHDFNNLLTVINGYSDLLLESLPPGDGARELVTEIHRAGERSAGLTRQLLAFSRQQVLAPRLLDLNTVVADTERMLRRLIGEDVRLVVAGASDLWPVKADPGQVEQVLMNLCVNARDAMPQGGRLTIATQNVDLDDDAARDRPDSRPGPYVRLSVSDTGHGMTDEVKAKLFEPFFTTKEQGKGTGLGLATVYGIVKQSGGYVEVKSEAERGAVFEVYLPRAEEAPRDARSPSKVLAPLRGTETVLLVEDEAAVRALTRHVLASRGYTVLEAADGDEALQAATDHPGPIHLLIADVVMPGMGGRVVAEQVAQGRPEVRVLFVSGYTDDAIVRHGVLHDKVNFLQKPFSPTALAQKVREVLDGPV